MISSLLHRIPSLYQINSLNVVRTMAYKPITLTITPKVKIKHKISSWKLERKKVCLQLYKQLLILGQQFEYDLYKNYIINHVRERFRFNAYQRDNTRIRFLIEEAKQIKDKLTKCLQGDKQELKYLDDLVYGRIGRLKVIVDSINSHPKRDIQPHRAFTDTRSKLSKIRLPKFEPIPLDVRVTMPLVFNKPVRKVQKPSNFAYLVRTSFVYTFLRFKSRRQPPWVSMMVRSRLLKRQRELDLYNMLKSYLNDLNTEKIFLNLLNQNTDELVELESLLLESIKNLEVNNQLIHQRTKAKAAEFKFIPKQIIED